MPSPFDLKRQGVIVVPQEAPRPPRGSRSDPEFLDAEEAWLLTVARHAHGLVKLCSGRTLLLFTSWRSLDYCHRYVAERFDLATSGIRLLVQGGAPTKELLERFRTNEHSALFGVASLWQGVDVPGDSLVCVMIDKLPFPVPTDPLEAGLTEMMKERGQDAFKERSIPLVAIAMRQGVGRLIRTETDFGLVVITDTRLIQTPYGREIMHSLPFKVAPSYESAQKAVPSVFARIKALPKPAQGE